MLINSVKMTLYYRSRSGLYSYYLSLVYGFDESLPVPELSTAELSIPSIVYML